MISCFTPLDRYGRTRGFAYVTMSIEDAETACREVNGKQLNGRPLRVSKANER